MESTERYSRQSDLVPANRLAQCDVSVVGVGAVGRQVALQLTAMGAPRLRLFDFDVVEESNLASQGYREADLGQPKVEATADACREINVAVDIAAVNGRFQRKYEAGNVVFACVDSIDGRRFLWNAVKGTVQLFIDGRVGGEVIRVLTARAGEVDGRKYYPTTLFDQSEAHVGSCTAKMTIYCANLAAALMVAQFAKWLRRMPMSQDLMFNLLSEEVSVSP